VLEDRDHVAARALDPIAVGESGAQTIQSGHG
jgi:hypothetical protein